MLNKEQNILMREDDYPTLRKYVGEDLVFTDGTTLLGGDDKAAVASIMTMAEFFCRHPEIPHGPIKLCFTPDEEIARSTENFSVERLGQILHIPWTETPWAVWCMKPSTVRKLS